MSDYWLMFMFGVISGATVIGSIWQTVSTRRFVRGSRAVPPVHKQPVIPRPTS